MGGKIEQRPIKEIGEKLTDSTKKIPHYQIYIDTHKHDGTANSAINHEITHDFFPLRLDNDVIPLHLT